MIINVFKWDAWFCLYYTLYTYYLNYIKSTTIFVKGLIYNIILMKFELLFNNKFKAVKFERKIFMILISAATIKCKNNILKNEISIRYS